MGYDIIGDIHGQAGKLRRLLTKMGYALCGDVWHHLHRRAIFVGDFIDRGPHQLETLDIVRRMVAHQHALAVLGNHEFNAIAWHTEDPALPGHYLRTRVGEKGEKNRKQHQVFLNEVQHDPARHEEIVQWFMTLPLWLDLPELRVIHACWHPDYMASLKPKLKNECLDRDLIAAASRKHSAEYQAVETLTKGLEISLPPGITFKDKDGHTRKEVRVRWWDTEAKTFRQAAVLPEESAKAIPDLPIPPSTLIGYTSEKPVFFGHYWRTGTPRVLAPNVACVDYSAGHGGPLVAYQWDGESTLNDSHFVTSD
ncbi:metallophosphoesterase [Paraburkholderia sacchari]|uniref:metallophosphoesterase n=1 Tax=Paraburkholderia sacchari TaxID=159450 RepID=UPI001BD1150B|nr:metallophosphoesterase [Paraburkholderia sacchari]